MKNILIILLIFFPRLVSSQWITQYIDENVTLYDVRFINEKTGWICGGNLIYKTTNSGVSWLRQPNPAQTGNLYQIHPVNENVVYACGICTILKTTNGGENWTAIRVGSPPCGDSLPDVRAVWFNDENKGWFSGNVQAMRTTNGGISIVDSQRVEIIATDLFFRDYASGVMVGGGLAYRTSNSGVNWIKVELPFTRVVPFCWRLTFIGDIGWTAAENNTIFQTTNFGISWDSIAAAQTDRTFYPIEFVNLSTGYAGAHPVSMFKTTDGGIHWEMQTIPSFSTPSGFLSVFALNDTMVWAVGAYGKIIHTQNGGLTNITSLENTSADFNLYQNFPNPFNPITKIAFDIGKFSRVSLKIYDINGRHILQPVSKELNPGKYETQINAQNLSSGAYFYMLEVDGMVMFAKTMIVLK